MYLYTSGSLSLSEPQNPQDPILGNMPRHVVSNVSRSRAELKGSSAATRTPSQPSIFGFQLNYRTE
jgi:hypothetical protein